MAFEILEADRLTGIDLSTVALSGAEAELRIELRFDKPVGQVEFRGRLTGPHCHYASTVEIAYPFRPVPGAPKIAADAVVGRVVIPEPNLWTPSLPFHYEGVVELWAQGRSLAKLRISQGLRTLQLQSGKVRWNAGQVLLRGRRIERASESDAMAWRQAGYNTWLVEVGPHADALAQLADRLGFFLVAEVKVGPDPLLHIQSLARRTCCVAFVVPDRPAKRQSWRDRLTATGIGGKQLMGTAVGALQDGEDWADVDFVLGHQQKLPANLPLLVYTDEEQTLSAPAKENLLGYVVE